MQPELKGHYSISLPYSPEEMRIGYTDPDLYYLNKKISKFLLEGKSRVQQLHSKYTASYLTSQIFSVRSYRDMLMSLALSLSIRSVQTRDTAYLSLTTQSKRYWNVNGDTFWSDIPSPSSEFLKKNQGLYGSPGSAAFSMYLNNNNSADTEILDFLKNCIDYSLEDIDCSYETSSSDCQESFISKLHIDEIPCVSYEFVLDKLLLDSNQTPHINLLKKVRSSLLTQSDWEHLRQRLILGEYSNELFDVLKEIEILSYDNEEFRSYYGLSKPEDLYLEQFKEESLSIFKPSGSPYFYQIMILKGLVEAIEVLENISDDLFDQDIAFLLTDQSNKEWLIEAASSIATSYDAASALAKFKTIYEAEGLGYRFYLTSLQLIKNLDNPYISEIGPKRLFNFTKQ